MSTTTQPPGPPAALEALRSVHTTNLAGLFAQLQISLLVTTYQAGKVILVRNDGGVLNTHFLTLAKPMGLATDRGRLSIGGARMVWEYGNVPAVAQKIPPAGKYDACFLPRRLHVTGDIDIHEMAYDAQGELWVVNTRFGCLCTLEAAHNFHPRWRPPFLSALAPEDRCHLNGLGMAQGRPRYVTALGETDTAGGWRANKASGGLLLDIETNEILLRGLSMPHSPRWYQDRLWLLESGQGSLAVVDLHRRTRRTIAQLPGFTRGIDFVGPLAFIGLSQVRETAVFSGIPLVERLKERTCGVWVVHIETGATVGFLRFEAGVQEIFAVQVLQGIRFPEMLEWHDERLAHSYVLPDEALAEVAMPSAEDLARSPVFHLQRGRELFRQGQLAEAIAAFRQCLELGPEDHEARYHLGVALGDIEQYDEALTQLGRVIQAEPERADAYNSLGYVYSRQGQPQQAIAAYERAIALQPDHALAHLNLAMTLLQTGDYARGFTEYEWRWRTGQFTPFRCPHPQWDGQPIPDQTLLIHTEQGAGDTIQFARFLPLAAQRCRRLLVAGPRDLLPLLAAAPGIQELREAGEIGVHEFDRYLALMSLPRVLGITPDTVPAQVPYLDVEALRRRKGAAVVPWHTDRRRRVGLVWRGSPTHRDDRRRSCPLHAWVPFLRTPGVAFYSLQRGAPAQELAGLPPEVTVQDLEPVQHDFGDLAWVMLHLDLVITVDTSSAHVAGALGRPVWTLLSAVPDWRWALAGETTPWYPTMRLFRQPQPGDWATAAAQVAQAMEEWAADRRGEQDARWPAYPPPPSPLPEEEGPAIPTLSRRGPGEATAGEQHGEGA
jgi:uncharacterized protein (TIGR03032 family)